MLRLNDARKRKYELLASLTPFEVELLDIARSSGGHVFGHRPGKRDPDTASAGRIALTYPARQVSVRKRVHDERVVDDGQAAVDGLVRAGWLRFAPQPGADSDTVRTDWLKRPFCFTTRSERNHQDSGGVQSAIDHYNADWQFAQCSQSAF